MSYAVETTPKVRAQIFTMPKAGQVAFAALLGRIADDPWDAPSWMEGASTNMRQAAFGDQGQGLALYLIIDRDERVAVVDVVWAG